MQSGHRFRPLATTCLFLPLLFLPASLTRGVTVQGSAFPAIEPPPHAGYAERIPGTTMHFDMVAIPGGKFLMGSPRNEAARRDDEGPLHPVQVGAFWMGKCEVTWEEYDLFRQGDVPAQATNEEMLTKDADAVTRPTQPYPDETRGMGRDGRPAVGISHHAAMEYCRWLSKQTGKRYRLPTEAEWEWACRAGTRTAYFFGDEPTKLGNYAWFVDNAGEATHPVGKKRANPWGLHDIYGNVAEWCLDHYRADDYRTLPLDRMTFTPVRLPTAARYSHVVRGGSWDQGAAACRSASRLRSDASWNRIDPERHKSLWWLWNADFVGFRVVCAVEEQPALQTLRSKVVKESE